MGTFYTRMRIITSLNMLKLFTYGTLYIMWCIPERFVVRTLRVFRCGSGPACIIRIVGHEVTTVQIGRQNKWHLHDQPHHRSCLWLNLERRHFGISMTSSNFLHAVVFGVLFTSEYNRFYRSDPLYNDNFGLQGIYIYIYKF